MPSCANMTGLLKIVEIYAQHYMCCLSSFTYTAKLVLLIIIE